MAGAGQHGADRDTAVPLQLVLELARRDEGAEPQGFVFKTQTYRRRLSSGLVKDAQLPWQDGLFQDLSEAAAPSGNRAPVQRIGDVLTTFLQQLDWPKDEKDIEEAINHNRPVDILLRFAAAELFALPWELVTLGQTGTHLGAIQGMTFRYVWPGTNTVPSEPPPEGEKTVWGRILFAWSNAGGEVPADAHRDALTAACSSAGLPFDELCEELPDATYAKLGRALDTAKTEGRPFTVLHLLCHGELLNAGSAYGLVLHADDTTQPKQTIDGPTLADQLRCSSLVLHKADAAGSQVPGTIESSPEKPPATALRLVVLSACYSAAPGMPASCVGSVAQALHRVGFEAIVAPRFPLTFGASVALTQGLYQGLLVELLSLEDALSNARMLIRQNLPTIDSFTIQLHARPEDRGTRPFVVRPYRGLLAFEEDHRRFFFGRDDEVQAVIKRMETLVKEGRPCFVAVAGASGTGKSSLIRAGVIPALRMRYPGLKVELFRPGHDPRKTLREAVLNFVDGSPSLLVVDQFEEVFTQVEDDQDTKKAMERAKAFAGLLWELAKQSDRGVWVIVSLRVDYLERYGKLPLDDTDQRLDQIIALPAHGVILANMSRQQFRAAIEGPAKKLGLSFDDGLVGAMLEDVGVEERGALPALEYALDRLWFNRSKNRLTQSAYESIGYVTGALRGKAEEILDSLNEKQKRMAQRLWLGLVALQEDAVLDTRRRRPLSKLRPESAQEAVLFDAMLDKLVSARLFVRDYRDGQATVEVAHEALIRKWERGQVWVKEEREKQASLDEVERWADNLKNFPNALLDKDRLAHAKKVRDKYPGELSKEASQLIQKSERKERRNARITRLIIGLLSMLTLSTTIGLVLADHNANVASKNEALALEREVDAKRRTAEAKAEAFLTGGDPGVALAWLRKAPSSFENAARAYQAANQGLSWVLPTHQESVRKVAWSKQGRLLATQAEEGVVQVWDLGSGAHWELTEHPGTATWAWSPDGKTLATGSKDGSLRLWNSENKTTRLLGKHEKAITASAWAPDGKTLASGSADHAVRVWLAADGTFQELPGHQDTVVTLAWSSTGEWLASGASDGGLMLSYRQSALRTERVQTGGPVDMLAWSPKGDMLAMSSQHPDNRQVLVLSIKDNKRASLDQHGADISALAWSPDGQKLATGSFDTKIRIWSVQDYLDDPKVRMEPSMLEGHQAGVSTLAWSPDGRFLASGSFSKGGTLHFPWSSPENNHVRVWDVSTKEARQLRGHGDNVVTLDWSPDGRALVTGSRDRTVRIWDLAPDLARAFSTAASLSSDGKKLLVGREVRDLETEATKTLADFKGVGVWSPADPDGLAEAIPGTQSEPGQVRLWNISSGSFKTVYIYPKDVFAKLPLLRWSPDGKRLAFCPKTVLRFLSHLGQAYSPDPEAMFNVFIWYADKPEKVDQLTGYTGAIWDLAWSADSKLLATSSSDRSTLVWSDTGKVPDKLEGHEAVRDLSWSPQASILAYKVATGEVKLWDARSKQTRTLGYSPNLAEGLAWSKDGKLLAAGTGDGAVLIWNTQTGELRTLKGYQPYIKSMAWSPAQNHVLAVGAMHDSIRVWDVDQQVALRLEGHDSMTEIVELQWFPDGRRLLATSSHGPSPSERGARLWTLLTEEAAYQEFLRNGPNIAINEDGSIRVEPFQGLPWLRGP